MMPTITIDDSFGLRIALEQARKSHAEGGIPIGAALIYHEDDPQGGMCVLGAGHNQRMQKSSAILHGEIAALDAAGRLKPEVYRSSTMVRNDVRNSCKNRFPLHRNHVLKITTAELWSFSTRL